jgi:tRNA G46 methylase TrmB
LQGDNAYLITNEALSLYKRKLKRDGVIIFNTTNKNLNYKKVLAKYVQDNNLRYSYFVVRYPEKYIDNFDNTSFIIFGKRNKIYKRFEKFTLKKGGVEAFDSVNAIKTRRIEF